MSGSGNDAQKIQFDYCRLSGLMRMPEQFIHGYALLVGVGTTADPKLSLPVTVKDARAIKAILTDPRHCAYPDDTEHVRLLHDEDASRRGILDGLDWLAEKGSTDPEATVVIYYSGHGMLDSAKDAYYLIPHEFNHQAVEQTALSAETLGSRLGAIATKRLWVIIDSCHAEGMATAKDSLPPAFLPTALPKGAVDSLKQGEGRAVFTSSRGQQSSWVRPDGALSLYTYHLIEALKGAANQVGDRQVTISNVMTHLGKTVPASAQTLCQAEQIPFFNTATEDFAVALLSGGKGLSFSDQKPESPTMMTNQSEQPLSSFERLKLLQTLNALPPAQFEEILGALNPPRGIVADGNANQSSRTSQLMGWVEGPSGRGLNELVQILNLYLSNPSMPLR